MTDYRAEAERRLRERGVWVSVLGKPDTVTLPDAIDIAAQLAEEAVREVHKEWLKRHIKDVEVAVKEEREMMSIAEMMKEGYQYEAEEAESRLLRVNAALVEALSGLIEQLDGIGVADWHGAEGLDIEPARAALKLAVKREKGKVEVDPDSYDCPIHGQSDTKDCPRC